MDLCGCEFQDVVVDFRRTGLWTSGQGCGFHEDVAVVLWTSEGQGCGLQEDVVVVLWTSEGQDCGLQTWL